LEGILWTFGHGGKSRGSNHQKLEEFSCFAFGSSLLDLGRIKFGLGWEELEPIPERKHGRNGRSEHLDDIQISKER
jgi:hypothetical protein